MRNRVKYFFPASLMLAVCLLVESAMGQAPEPQSTPSPTATPPNAPPPQATRTTRAVPNIPDDPFNTWAFGLNYWLNTGPSDLLPGSQSANPPAQHLMLAGANKKSFGFTFIAPAGKYNRLEFTGFQAKASGTSIAPVDVTYFGQTYPAGDTLLSDYRVRAFKVSYNYLTYPAPPTSKFRLKALFELQYVSSNVSVSAPLDLFTLPASGSRHIFVPTFGLGSDIVPSRAFHLELKGSGWALPGKSLIIDGEANGLVRVSRLEIVAGAKFYRYRTSPNNDQFVQGRFFGPQVGLRYVFGGK
jgi:hypothetical protein